MTEENFKLEYLPIFWDDLRDIVSYMQNTLKAPLAAQSFIEEVEQGILAHLKNPTIAVKYPSLFERDYPYYWFSVGSYMIFYVLIDDVMEVRRCVYGRRDLKGIL